ncbi:HSFY1 protein, partial [Heliornis fulica]|nr:HSFY1 protein [Heliornis fulica]
LRFPHKLRAMLDSGRFRSLWWSHQGKCVAINEGLFKEEVLGRAGPRQGFNMKSFICQLNRYGFTRVHPDEPRSASLPEFLAEEEAASAHSQVLYYYNPSFSRDRHHLLNNCKRR